MDISVVIPVYNSTTTVVCECTSVGINFRGKQFKRRFN